MPVLGTDLVLKNLALFGGRFLAGVDETMTHLAEGLGGRVAKNASLTDHSLSALRRLGHPYATRHGAGASALHDPAYQVHDQGGPLRPAIFHRATKARLSAGTLEASAIAGVDEAKAPYAAYVVFGTTKMVPRDFLTGALQEYRPEAFAILRQRLRNAAISFKAQGVRGGIEPG